MHTLIICQNDKNEIVVGSKSPQTLYHVNNLDLLKKLIEGFSISLEPFPDHSRLSKDNQAKLGL